MRPRWSKVEFPTPLSLQGLSRGVMHGQLQELRYDEIIEIYLDYSYFCD